jgi:hypothetical protein
VAQQWQQTNAPVRATAVIDQATGCVQAVGKKHAMKAPCSRQIQRVPPPVPRTGTQAEQAPITPTKVRKQNNLLPDEKDPPKSPSKRTCKTYGGIIRYKSRFQTRMLFTDISVQRQFPQKHQSPGRISSQVPEESVA